VLKVPRANRASKAFRAKLVQPVHRVNRASKVFKEKLAQQVRKELLVSV
jgi:hypothetical protein